MGPFEYLRKGRFKEDAQYLAHLLLKIPSTAYYDARIARLYYISDCMFYYWTRILRDISLLRWMDMCTIITDHFNQDDDYIIKIQETPGLKELEKNPNLKLPDDTPEEMRKFFNN